MAPYPNSEAYAETNARSTAYLFGTDDACERPGGAGEGSDGALGGGAGSTPGRGPGVPPGGGAGGTRIRLTSLGGAHTSSPTAAANGTGPTGRGPRGHRRRRKAVPPVRTGLLGVTAAVALGTVAVVAGLIPGLQNYRLGGGPGSGGHVRAVDSPGNSATEQGGSSGSAESSAGALGTGGGVRLPSLPGLPASAAATGSPEKQAPSPTATPSPSATAGAATTATPAPGSTSSPSAPKSPAPPRASSAPVTVSVEAVAAAEVLNLVNDQRAKAGCSAVSANSALSALAASFSADMAARGFFDHTDPDGHSPWDRAAKAGITGLGGENIARGQTDAAAVMQAWMNSPGHRANILNCDFKTLGVGVHFGPGGPWWTEDFGY
ncbi:CAP domain-containing protein [Streptomyces sp. NPDC005573]|uniref:CAP domain-containing protein n=1 Tax=Streptomyces sp. NPDC005573 TaxID=3156890 RepID=UPI0033B8439A